MKKKEKIKKTISPRLGSESNQNRNSIILSDLELRQGSGIPTSEFIPNSEVPVSTNNNKDTLWVTEKKKLWHTEYHNDGFVGEVTPWIESHLDF